MKTAKELFTRIQSDDAFAKEFGDKLRERKQAGSTSQYDTLIPVAAEYGYEVTESQIDAISNGIEDELSEEELGKVAGGTSCLTALTFVLTASAFYTAVETIFISIDKLAE